MGFSRFYHGSKESIMPLISPYKILSFACALTFATTLHAQEPETPKTATTTLSTQTPDKKPSAKKSEDSGDADAAPKGGGRRGRNGPGGGGGGAADKVAYDFELPGPDGKGIPLSTYKGKTLLIVNLGRNSSYATQIAGLEKLAGQYKDKGLVVIGVPSDEFGAAEPGTDSEIQTFYKDQDKVTFPIMAKSRLDGDDALPFFEFLEKAQLSDTGPVHWNFTKFIIDKTGKPLVRIDPAVAPDSPEMQTIVTQVLEDRYKAPTGGDAPKGRRGGA
jgi:glutathione peroxidase